MAIGLGGAALVTEPQIHGLFTPNGRQAYLAGGYGGLLVEYTIAPARVAHLTVPVLVGVGGMNYSTHSTFLSRKNGGSDNLPGDTSDVFFVTEVGLNLEVTITHFLRLYLGTTYRYVDGVKLPYTTNTDLTGFNATAGIKVGFL